MCALRHSVFAAVLLLAVAPAFSQTAPSVDEHHPEATPGTASPDQTPAPGPGQPGTMGPMMGQGAQPGMMGPMMGQGAQPGMMGQAGMGAMMGGGGPLAMMGGMGSSMGPRGPMGMPFEHVEGRLAFVKTELKVTPAQEPQWNKFADAFRSVAAQARASLPRMMPVQPATAPERLDAYERMLTLRLDAVRQVRAAFDPLYASLTDEQKKTADELLARPMGMM